MATDLAIAEGLTAQSAPPTLTVRDLGLVPYEECWQLQRDLAAVVIEGHVGDTLLLLEHPHTYTCGRSGGRNHILADEEELGRIGAIVLDVDRGGDVTYHGPGQLVAYPIINLFATKIGRDYRAYVRSLEEVLIRALADFEISSYRVQGYSGVWVRGTASEEKIAAIGVKVDGRGVTSHGIALNVETDLSYFSRIVPCGIVDKGVTSMSQLLALPSAMADVKSAFVTHFKEVFGYH
ncbi:MAG TPA: lipoyl(octanoyl) transferase LipB [Chloroflexia bacterium]|nr:lipoyl(octanoyl) transferase LipB [Chloroflexia bacterium]